MSPLPPQPQWPSYGLVLGAKLFQLRQMRGLTQQQVADRAQLTRNTISLLERNENTHGGPADPVLSTIYRLASALEVPPAVLLPAAARVPVKLAESVEDLSIDITWPVTELDTMTLAQREGAATRDTAVKKDATRLQPGARRELLAREPAKPGHSAAGHGAAGPKRERAKARKRPEARPGTASAILPPPRAAKPRPPAETPE